MSSTPPRIFLILPNLLEPMTDRIINTPPGYEYMSRIAPRTTAMVVEDTLKRALNLCLVSAADDVDDDEILDFLNRTNPGVRPWTHVIRERDDDFFLPGAFSCPKCEQTHLYCATPAVFEETKALQFVRNTQNRNKPIDEIEREFNEHENTFVDDTFKLGMKHKKPVSWKDSIH
jgi:hypothetical protein